MTHAHLETQPQGEHVCRTDTGQNESASLWPECDRMSCSCAEQSPNASCRKVGRMPKVCRPIGIIREFAPLLVARRRNWSGIVRNCPELSGIGRNTAPVLTRRKEVKKLQQKTKRSAGRCRRVLLLRCEFAVAVTRLGAAKRRSVCLPPRRCVRDEAARHRAQRAASPRSPHRNQSSREQQAPPS